MHDWLSACYRLLCDHSLITNQTVIMQVINEEMAGLALLNLEARPPSIREQYFVATRQKMSPGIVSHGNRIQRQSSLTTCTARCLHAVSRVHTAHVSPVSRVPLLGQPLFQSKMNESLLAMSVW